MESLRYVLRNLVRRRLATALGIAGIFLTIALLTAIRIGLDSISTSYIDLVALQAGKTDVLIMAEGGARFQPKLFDPADALARLKDDPDLKGLTPRLTGLCRVKADTKQRTAMLLGIDPPKERDLDTAGLRPEPSLENGTCAISENLAAKLNARAGAAITVEDPDGWETLQFKVGTVIERQMLVPQQVKDFVVLNEADARKLLGQPEKVHFLAGAFDNPRSYYDARDLHSSVMRLKDAGESLSTTLGLDHQILLPKAAAITAFQNFTSPVRVVFGVFAVFALAITGLLIYSLISVAVEERVREYAILRTLGARRRRIFQLVLGESAALCLLGVAPGVLAGIGFAQIVVNFVELAMKAEGDPVTLLVSNQTLLLTLGAGAALSIGSALAPALRATRLKLADALAPLRTGQIAEAPREEGGANRPLLATGLALSGLSVVVFFILPGAFLSGNPSLIGTVVLCLLLTILLGFTLVSVGALPLVERVTLAFTGWVYGASAELAARNLSRHRRRNTATALMFSLSVSFVIFIASLISLFSGATMALVEQTNGADLRLQSGGPPNPEMMDELRGIDGVASVSEVRQLRPRSNRGVAYDVVLGDVVGMKQLWVTAAGIDTDFAGTLFTNGVQFAEGGLDAFAALAADTGFAATGAETNAAFPPVILSQAAARFLDLEADDPVQLTFQLGAQRRVHRFRVEAVCGALPGFRNFRARVAAAVGSGVLLSRPAFDAMTEGAPDEAFHSTFLARVGDADKQRAVAHRLREEFGVRYQFGVESVAEQKSKARALYWVTQVFFGLLMVVAVIIAVFSLIAAMATSVIERRWEIGVLKSLGLRRGHLLRIFLCESVTLTLSSGVSGGLMGFGLAWLFMLQAAVLIEMPVVFTVPWFTFAATLFVSIVAGVFAARLPTRRILRRAPAEILRQTAG